MITSIAVPNLSELYEADETAWLEQMALHAADGEVAALDLPHLSEYLSDMARRDRREVVQRLAVLFSHLLKWDHQPDRRTRSWELTIQEQREELQDLLESGTLRNHAEQELGRAYQKAVRRAAIETELPESTFAVDCPLSLDQVVGE
jgi:Domain of unknown function DUF29